MLNTLTVLALVPGLVVAVLAVLTAVKTGLIAADAGWSSSRATGGLVASVFLGIAPAAFLLAVLPRDAVPSYHPAGGVTGFLLASVGASIILMSLLAFVAYLHRRPRP